MIDVVCDGDGVLFAFVETCCERLGIPVPEDGWHGVELWDALRTPETSLAFCRDPDFWRELPRYPWADDLVDCLGRLAAALGGRLFFASRVRFGDANWIGRAAAFDAWSATRGRFVLTAGLKGHSLSTRRALLLDDSPEEALAWGPMTSVIFPQVWNGTVTAEQRWTELRARFTGKIGTFVRPDITAVLRDLAEIES